MKLGEFETGARVVKTTAIPFDAAFGSVGTVERNAGMIGVRWDSWAEVIVQYQDDQPGFEPAGVN